jgi:hypothetical protein
MKPGGGPVGQPYAGVNFIPQSETMNLATAHRKRIPI